MSISRREFLGGLAGATVPLALLPAEPKLSDEDLGRRLAGGGEGLGYAEVIAVYEAFARKLAEVMPSPDKVPPVLPRACPFMTKTNQEQQRWVENLRNGEWGDALYPRVLAMPSGISNDPIVDWPDIFENYARERNLSYSILAVPNTWFYPMWHYDMAAVKRGYIEVPQVDEKGKQVFDSSGKPVMLKTEPVVSGNWGYGAVNILDRPAFSADGKEVAKLRVYTQPGVMGKIFADLPYGAVYGRFSIAVALNPFYIEEITGGNPNLRPMIEVIGMPGAWVQAVYFRPKSEDGAYGPPLIENGRLTPYRGNSMVHPPMEGLIYWEEGAASPFVVITTLVYARRRGQTRIAFNMGLDELSNPIFTDQNRIFEPK